MRSSRSAGSRKCRRWRSLRGAHDAHTALAQTSATVAVVGGRRGRLRFAEHKGTQSEFVIRTPYTVQKRQLVPNRGIDPPEKVSAGRRHSCLMRGLGGLFDICDNFRESDLRTVVDVDD